MKLLPYLIVLLTAIVMADKTNLEEILHSGNNGFTGNMFSEIVKENPGRSVVFSAFSVMTPLAQLALASEGPSHNELLKSIGMSSDAITKDVFVVIDTKLRSVKGVELKTANKVYVSLNYELNPEYATASRDVFHSEVAKVDFLKSQATAKEINDWVEEQTNHRIKDLVDPNTLGPDTRAVLVNALYFKGAWETPFEKSLTREHDFYVTKKQVVKLPMMYNNADFKYYQSEVLNSKILEIPYAGQKTSMLFVLPDEVDGIGHLIVKMKNLSVLDNESNNLYEAEVMVHIPKFKIETTTDLKKILKNMNVEKLFNPNEAKLNKLLLGASDLYISNAVQKAFIEVNEEGAEAAAANAFIAETDSLIIKPVAEFNANHPFVYMLKANDEILFSGVFYGY